MISPLFIVAFSGHRPKKDHEELDYLPGRSPEEIEECRDLVTRALTTFRDQAAEVNGEIHLLSSVAEGADLLACEVAESLGIPIHIILPKQESDFLENFNTQDRSTAESFIENSKSEYSFGTFRVADASYTDDCYADTNLQMLESADALIVLWDGNTAKGVGGTAEVWQDAQQRHLPRIHVNPLKGEDSNHETAIYSLTDEHTEQSGLHKLNEINKRLETPESSQTENISSLETIEKKLNNIASASAKNTRDTLLKAAILHGLAAYIGAAGISYALAHGPHPLLVLIYVSITEVFLIGYAEYLHHKHHKDHQSAEWLYTRCARELIRPLKVSLPYLDLLLPQIQHHDPSWRRFVLSVSLTQRFSPDPDIEIAKEHYIKKRIVDKENETLPNGDPNLDPQIHYFKHELAKTKKPLNLYRPLLKYAGYFALFVVICAVIYKAQNLHWNLLPTDDLSHNNPHQELSLISFFIYLLPIALPLIAAIATALRQSLDHGRRSVSYKSMIKLLELAEITVRSASTKQALRRAVNKTELILLTELKEFEQSQLISMETTKSTHKAKKTH